MHDVPSKFRGLCVEIIHSPAGQIDNFKELAEQFTTRFITNSRVVKRPEALNTLKEKEGRNAERILNTLLIIGKSFRRLRIVISNLP